VSEEHKAMVGRMVEAINAGEEAAAVDKLFAPPSARRVKRLFAEFRSAFPDWQEEIVELIAEGNTVAGRFKCSGTHLGAAGIALLLTFGRLGLVGQYLNVFGINLSFTTAAVVMAEVFVAAHFYVRQATVGFSQVRRDVEEAAMVDGAGRVSTFFRVTVPLAFPALVAGAVMSWARALGEFGGTVIFAGSFRGITQTIPLAIFAVFQSNIDAAVALSVMVLGFAFTVIVVARYLLGKAA
jgi:ABC-type molybdate transport system permease subunit